MKRTLIITFLIMMATNFFIGLVSAQYYQKADFGDISVTRKNQLGGYDYYDKEGKLQSYSRKNYQGDYIYYDKVGNELGVLKQDQKTKAYTFYNPDNIPTTTLQKMPTGEYRSQDKFEGGLIGFTPPPGEDIGFIPPSSLLEGPLKPQLEGNFKKKE